MSGSLIAMSRLLMREEPPYRTTPFRTMSDAILASTSAKISSMQSRRIDSVSHIRLLISTAVYSLFVEDLTPTIFPWPNRVLLRPFYELQIRGEFHSFGHFIRDLNFMLGSINEWCSHWSDYLQHLCSCLLQHHPWQWKFLFLLDQSQ